MSHFSVLVPAKDEKELDERLIPYYEYGCSQTYDDILEARGLLAFIDETDDYLKEYNEGHTDRVKVGEQLLSTRDEQFRVRDTDSKWPNSYKYDHGDYPVVDVPYKELYPTFEAYMTEYCDMQPDEKHPGRYGHYQNPNRKWDWYVPGGRWEGRLILKSRGPLFAAQTANEALVSEIDFEAMIALARERKLKEYDQYHRLKSMTEEERSATDIREKVDLLFLRDEEIAEYESNTREQIAESFVPPALSYAFIDLEGKWNEEAEMGWWGITTNPNADYASAYQAFLKSLPSDQRVYIVDCHI